MDDLQSGTEVPGLDDAGVHGLSEDAERSHEDIDGDGLADGIGAATYSTHDIPTRDVRKDTGEHLLSSAIEANDAGLETEDASDFGFRLSAADIASGPGRAPRPIDVSFSDAGPHSTGEIAAAAGEAPPPLSESKDGEGSETPTAVASDGPAPEESSASPSPFADPMPGAGAMTVNDDSMLVAPETGYGDVWVGDVEGDGFADGVDASDPYSDWTEQPYDYSGYWADSAGDVNGDGIDDLIVTSYSYADGTHSSSTHVVFGAADGTPFAGDVADIDGSDGFRIDGAASEYGNTSAAAAGDVNGDGYDDLIVGTYGWGASAASYVIFGGAGGFLATLDVSTLDGSNGFRIEGLESSDYGGWSASGGGDINGDGFDDLLIDTWEYAPGGAYSSSSYVVLGHAGGFDASVDLAALDGTNGYELPPDDAADPGEDGGEVIIGIDEDGVHEYPLDDPILIGLPVTRDLPISIAPDDLLTPGLFPLPALTPVDFVL